MSASFQRAHNIADMRTLARRRLPRGMFEFIDRGTEDEVALRANRAAFERITLRPRVLMDVSHRRLQTSIFGHEVTMPLAIAPTGAAGLLWYEGEIAVARAAAEAGIPYTLSTVSFTALERMADAVKGRLWFQLYLTADAGLNDSLVSRAQAAGYEALVLTVDTVGDSNREYNLRNGFTVPVSLSARSMVDAALRPGWLCQVFLRQLLLAGMPRFANFPAEHSGLRSRQVGATMAKKKNLSWDDLADIRRKWQGPLILKGVLNAADASRAVTYGVDAVVVSNHGGRNLDACPAPITVLPRIADAVARKATVIVDGGIWRGSDVVKALALGADLVQVGRAPLYGVAAGGEDGAARVLQLLRSEIDRVLSFLGCPDVADLGPQWIEAADFTVPRDTDNGPTA